MDGATPGAHKEVEAREEKRLAARRGVWSSEAANSRVEPGGGGGGGSRGEGDGMSRRAAEYGRVYMPGWLHESAVEVGGGIRSSNAACWLQVVVDHWA